jgi:hypothetical protein
MNDSSRFLKTSASDKRRRSSVECRVQVKTNVKLSLFCSWPKYKYFGVGFTEFNNWHLS